MAADMATVNLHRLVESHLTEHDVRYTNGRRALVGELVSAEGPRSAAELLG